MEVPVAAEEVAAPELQVAAPAEQVLEVSAPVAEVTTETPAPAEATV